MKIGHRVKDRIHLESTGGRWLLIVDERPVISTQDRRWLRRVAVKLRRILADGSPP
jgi:hypothetical protein